MSQTKQTQSILSVFPIPAFTDNYIWCVHNGVNCWVVDPGDASPVLDYIQSTNLTLKGILVTHHHNDHTGGILSLLKHAPEIPVLGPDYGNIQGLTKRLKEGDSVVLDSLDLELAILEVPGHTLDHIAFYGQNMLFCGDTLFSAGCGRLFEGTPQQMHESLEKLMKLPAQTKVYCTHEYTLANVNFALNVEPENQALHAYSDWAKHQRSQGLPTLPSNIEQQKAINPFLRAQQDEIKHNAEQFVGKKLSNETDVFAAIRQWKDNF
ncbi:hydroxyacylglutathione hydrolase [Aliiglaciecola sp. NS0011-25]|uniref:hydroxyacylglutathione hydrolase n=1 Tax=Aliiglaciecola sp. NS0011-25 TaxID=3127654 RepID=UPI00310489C0